jgi:hypothetical protein
MSKKLRDVAAMDARIGTALNAVLSGRWEDMHTIISSQQDVRAAASVGVTLALEQDEYAGVQAKWDSAASTVREILASVHSALGTNTASVKDMRGQVRSALQA